MGISEYPSNSGRNEIQITKDKLLANSPYTHIFLDIESQNSSEKWGEKMQSEMTNLIQGIEHDVGDSWKQIIKEKLITTAKDKDNIFYTDMTSGDKSNVALQLILVGYETGNHYQLISQDVTNLMVEFKFFNPKFIHNPKMRKKVTAMCLDLMSFGSKIKPKSSILVEGVGKSKIPDSFLNAFGELPDL